MCQSNGERICRYLAKYGAATLEEAEAGRTAPLPGIAIEKVLLVGTSNAGSLRILRELNRGRSYGTFSKAEVSREEVVGMMAGGEELDELSHELAEFAHTDRVGAAKMAEASREFAAEARSMPAVPSDGAPPAS